jgi:hypothetical protein
MFRGDDQRLRTTSDPNGIDEMAHCGEGQRHRNLSRFVTCSGAAYVLKHRMRLNGENRRRFSLLISMPDAQSSPSSRARSSNLDTRKSPNLAHRAFTDVHRCRHEAKIGHFQPCQHRDRRRKSRWRANYARFFLSPPDRKKHQQKYGSANNRNAVTNRREQNRGSPANRIITG